MKKFIASIQCNSRIGEGGLVERSKEPGPMKRKKNTVTKGDSSPKRVQTCISKKSRVYELVGMGV
jgi:hypothetical protein